MFTIIVLVTNTDIIVRIFDVNGLDFFFRVTCITFCPGIDNLTIFPMGVPDVSPLMSKIYYVYYI